MRHIIKTGGVKDFVYSDEDIKRIESEDTGPSREFKKSYHEWLKNKDKHKTTPKPKMKIHYRSYYNTHTFVTEILNIHLLQLMRLFEDIKEIRSIWIGGIEYTTKHNKDINFEIFKDYRTQFFSNLGETINLNELANQLRKLYRIIKELLLHYPTKKKASEKIIKNLLKDIDFNLKVKWYNRQLNKYHNIINKPLITPPPEQPPKHPKSPLLKYVVWLIIIVLIGYFVFINSNQFQNIFETLTNETKTKYVNKTIIELIPLSISFDKYLENKDDYHNKNVTLIGFLQNKLEGSADAGAYVDSIVDDFGNEINLFRLTAEQKELFIKKGITKELYNVTGTLKRKYRGLDLEVSKIVSSQRPTKKIEKQITVTEEGTYLKNITQTINRSKKQKSFNITSIFISIKDFVKDKLPKCSDGTKIYTCSINKSYYCNASKELIEKPFVCGCPDGKRFYKNDCILIIKCTDGTLDPECSTNKPLKCIKGELISKASECGCSINEIPDNEKCVSKFETGSKKININLRGKIIEYTLYKGLNDYLKGLDRSISYYSIPPTDKDFILRDLNNQHQKKYLEPLIDEIKKRFTDRDEQALVVINFVQRIPYDWEGVRTDVLTGKYPYEVLYTNTGVCSEKAELMVYFLRELGFATAILRFESENHDAVGVKCPDLHLYKDTGYCFVEPTAPKRIGYSYGNYVDVGRLTSYPKIIEISDGYALKRIY